MCADHLNYICDILGNVIVIGSVFAFLIFSSVFFFFLMWIKTKRIRREAASFSGK